MGHPPPPPPPASWPLPLLTHVRYRRDKGMSTNNWGSKYPRPNSKDFIPFPTQFPTSIVGYNRSYGSFGVESYGLEDHRVRPTLLPQYQVRRNEFLPNRCEVNMVQADAQRRLFSLIRRGTGVFHAPQVLTKCNGIKVSTNYTNIRECETTNKGDREEKSPNRGNKNDSKVNDRELVIKVEKEEDHDHLLPHGVVLPKEWTY